MTVVVMVVLGMVTVVMTNVTVVFSVMFKL